MASHLVSAFGVIALAQEVKCLEPVVFWLQRGRLVHDARGLLF